MVYKKRLPYGDDFSDSDTSDGDIREITPPSIVVKSPEKLDSKHVATETSNMFRSRKKRKATLANYLGPSPKRLWSENDELVILKGIVDYRNETGVDYLSDSGAFVDYIKDDIETNFSKHQLMCKIRKLKKKFRDNSAKNPCFTKSHDSEIFNLSMAIWGKDKAECVDGNMDKANGSKSKVGDFVQHEAATNGEPEDDDGSAKGDSCDDKFPYEKVDNDMENEAGEKESEEDEAVTNGKPENDDGSAKGDSCDGKLPCENVDKRMENETGGKESEEDGAQDEMCALKDALETTMFQHLSNYAQKLMLQNLKTLRGKERKELSDEWKALLVQEVQLKSKKQSFVAKLANAALDD